MHVSSTSHSNLFGDLFTLLTSEETESMTLSKKVKVDEKISSHLDQLFSTLPTPTFHAAESFPLHKRVEKLTGISITWLRFNRPKLEECRGFVQSNYNNIFHKTLTIELNNHSTKKQELQVYLSFSQDDPEPLDEKCLSSIYPPQTIELLPHSVFTVCLNGLKDNPFYQEGSRPLKCKFFYLNIVMNNELLIFEAITTYYTQDSHLSKKNQDHTYTLLNEKRTQTNFSKRNKRKTPYTRVIPVAKRSFVFKTQFLPAPLTSNQEFRRIEKNETDDVSNELLQFLISDERIH